MAWLCFSKWIAFCLRLPAVSVGPARCVLYPLWYFDLFSYLVSSANFRNVLFRRAVCLTHFNEYHLVMLLLFWF